MLSFQQIGVEARAVADTADEPFGDRLKCYFDTLTAGPCSDRLAQLTEALELALERGELQSPARPLRS